MWEIAGFLSDLGATSLSAYWLPVALWSGLALLVYALLRLRNQSNIAYQYHGRAALLLALPIGLAASFGTSWMQEVMQAAQSELSAKFIVIQSPISLPAVEPAASAPSLGVEWGEPMVWIGLVMAGILIVSIRQVVLLGLNLFGLRQFARSLDSRPLSTQFTPKIDELRDVRRVRLAYSEETEVPFTFGSLRPVIVLPSYLRHQREKRNMSIRHELTHIKHSDYALNVLLLLAEALFWFHPMVHRLHREVREYREISCDREVLSYSSISRRKYAELLLELAPRPVFQHLPNVSMSVEPNTLKRRIEVMQAYNRSNAPLRSSLLLTMVTALFVTGIMACTDLQRSNSTNEQPMEGEIVLDNPSIDVNGATVISASGDSADTPRISGPVDGVGALTLGRYGTFIFSGREFPQSEEAGRISGNTLSISRSGLEVVVRSQRPIADRDEVSLYVRHDLEFKAGESNGRPVMHSGFYPNWEAFRRYREANLNRLGGSSVSPPPPGAPSQQNEYFVAVEEEPQLIGGLAELQSSVDYPETARRASIEGQVVIQFIVNRQGRVEEPRVVRSVHPLLDEAAVEGIQEHARFRPGRQRGEAVRVQFSLPIIFRLQTGPVEDGSGRQPPPPPVRPDGEGMEQNSRVIDLSDVTDLNLDRAGDSRSSIRWLERQNMADSGAPKLELQELDTDSGRVSGMLIDARTGNRVPMANVMILDLDRATATGEDGTFDISNLEPGSYTLRVDLVGYRTLRRDIRIER
ncbi:MAG: TonB family protein [Balneolaceae bacterium]|nr:TonB family protein [Balneolaceae bacterium]